MKVEWWMAAWCTKMWFFILLCSAAEKKRNKSRPRPYVGCSLFHCVQTANGNGIDFQFRPFSITQMANSTEKTGKNIFIFTYLRQRPRRIIITIIIIERAFDNIFLHCEQNETHNSQNIGKKNHTQHRNKYRLVRTKKMYI